MKFFKYALLVIVIVAIGYAAFGMFQQRNFDENREQEGERHAVEIFEKISAGRDLRFSDYYSAKKAFQDNAGTADIRLIRIYTELNKYKGVPVLGGTIFSDLRHNKCKEGYLNLVTGEWSSSEDACIIYD